VLVLIAIMGAVFLAGHSEPGGPAKKEG